MTLKLDSYRGRRCYCVNGVSYCCPSLGLYGYSSERALHGAAGRKLDNPQPTPMRKKRTRW